MNQKCDPALKMKRFLPETINIEDEEDDEFLSQLAAAETLAVSRPAGQPLTKRPKPSPPKLEGAYVAALRGADGFPLSSRQGGAGAVVVTGGGGGGAGGDACFKCGKVGHWSRDCDSPDVAVGGRGTGDVGTKACVCGAGDCLVLTANTERNRGRKFFKCPVRQENGGCNFFEWCDGVTNQVNTNPVYDNNSNSQFPALSCPCGAGSCLILTAKTGKNVGQQFYRCPASQGSSCGFFKWCHDQATATGMSVNLNGYNKVDDRSAKTDPVRSTSSCFKCGQEGHWARDCSQSATDYSNSGGKSSSSVGSCYKCGKLGHWAKDCPANNPSTWQRH